MFAFCTSTAAQCLAVLWQSSDSVGGHFALFCPRQAPTTAIPGTLWTSAAVDNGLRCESRVFCALAQKLSWKSTFQKRPFHNEEKKSIRVTLSHFFLKGWLSIAFQLKPLSLLISLLLML